MAFRIRMPDGVEIEMDTGEEVTELLKVLPRTSPNGNNGGQPTIMKREHTDRSPLSEAQASITAADQVNRLAQKKATFMNLHRRLGSENQKGLIKALLEMPSGLTDDMLRERLHLKTNTSLAGVLCAITRHAQAVGIDFPVIEKGTHGNKIQYRLIQAAREAWQ